MPVSFLLPVNKWCSRKEGCLWLFLHCPAGERIVKSMAPSIYGHEFIKMGVAMALFGGQVSAVHSLAKRL
jgi:DNA replicative helicase MCM subunit Mcm2 (Cdc46/Mcm family)